MADKVQGYTLNSTKLQSGDDLLDMTYDPQAVGLLGSILAELKGIRARLDAGIKVQQVGSLATVSI